MKTTDLIKDPQPLVLATRFSSKCFRAGNFEPDPKIVKFVVVKQREESHAAKRRLNALLKR